VARYIRSSSHNGIFSEQLGQAQRNIDGYDSRQGQQISICHLFNFAKLLTMLQMQKTLL
jgi:hypothetical protein